MAKVAQEVNNPMKICTYRGRILSHMSTCKSHNRVRRCFMHYPVLHKLFKKIQVTLNLRLCGVSDTFKMHRTAFDNKLMRDTI